MSAFVTIASAEGRPPRIVRGPRRRPCACRAQSTQCTPTGLGTWQAGHTGRSQRWQRT